MSKNSVKDFLVTVGGVPDLEASVDNFREQCELHLKTLSASQSLVADAISTLFDQNPGQILSMDYIKSQAVALMQAQDESLRDPSLFAGLLKSAEDCLHANCNQAARPATAKRKARAEITGRPYSLKMGANGGFYRVADAPEGTDTSDSE